MTTIHVEYPTELFPFFRVAQNEPFKVWADISKDAPDALDIAFEILHKVIAG